MRRLHCLRALLRLLRSAEAGVEAVYQEVVDLVSGALAHPENAAVVLHTAVGTFRAGGGEVRGEPVHAAPVQVEGEEAARLEVYCVGGCACGDEDFALLDAVAEALAAAMARSRAKQALLASEAHFRTLIENASDLITFVDAGGTIFYASPSHATILGVEPARLVEQRLTDLAHAEDAALLEGALVRWGAGEGGERARYRVRRADGRWRLLESAGRRAAGAPGGIVVTSRDVTESAAAQESLATALTQLRAIFDHVDVAVLSLDMRSNRLLYASESCARLLGYTPEQLREDPSQLFRLVHPEDADAVEQTLHMQRQGVATYVEHRVVLPDGRTRWVGRRARPHIDEDGVLYRAEAIIWDVTERKELELQLLQAQKMEAVGRFAGGVAHDFNNVLTTVSGYAELLRESLDPQDRRRDDVSEILVAAERAASLTRQILAFSRRQVLQPRVLVVDDVVRNLQGMLRPLVGADIEFITEYAAHGGMVLADPTHIEQIVANLVLNARDALPAGGTIRLSTSTVTEGSQSSFVRITVRDDGTGMSETVQSHLFEPFFTTKEPGRGTGLGLATVYAIVTQSNGRIQVESAPGQGTTMCVDLPRIRAKATVQRLEVAERKPHRHATILLVEDDAAVRNLTCRLLRNAGYATLVAEDGVQGLDVLRNGHGIDLLLTDMVMPGMNGRQLVEQARVHRPHLRVLMMSGYTEDDILRRGGIGATDDYIAKPFTPEALLGRISALLDRPEIMH